METVAKKKKKKKKKAPRTRRGPRRRRPEGGGGPRRVRDPQELAKQASGQEAAGTRETEERGGGNAGTQAYHL
jgi:hypothetical protein